MSNQQVNQTQRTREMKESGVEWINEVPERWELSLLGSHFKERSEKVSDKEFPPLSVTKKGVVPQLENVAKTTNNDNRKKICINDFVINSRSDRKGSSGLSKYEGSTSNISIVLQLKNIFPIYAHYLLKSHGFVEEFYRWGTGIVADLWTTRYSSMKKITIPIPPLYEQQAIATYLDKKCSEIENLISEQKQAIENWKEYKQSLITETVTKGLNPDVELKDSGVDWVDKIPLSWELCPIKYVAKINPIYDSLLSHNDFISFAPMETLRTGKLKPYKALLHEVKGKYTPFKENDIVMAKVTPCFENNNIAIAKDLANGVGFGSSELYIFRATKCEIRYLYYFLQNNHFKQEGISNMYGTGGLKRVKSSFVENYKMSLPKIDEQQAIADYLDEKCLKIDQTIEQKQALIKQLEEYKQSLIYECVTGKQYVL